MSAQPNCHLLNLPLEIFEPIIDQIDNESIKSLSITCKAARCYFSPRIFKHFKFISLDVSLSKNYGSRIFEFPSSISINLGSHLSRKSVKLLTKSFIANLEVFTNANKVIMEEIYYQHQLLPCRKILQALTPNITDIEFYFAENNQDLYNGKKTNQFDFHNKRDCYISSIDPVKGFLSPPNFIQNVKLSFGGRPQGQPFVEFEHVFPMIFDNKQRYLNEVTVELQEKYLALFSDEEIRQRRPFYLPGAFGLNYPRRVNWIDKVSLNSCQSSFDDISALFRFAKELKIQGNLSLNILENSREYGTLPPDLCGWLFKDLEKLHFTVMHESDLMLDEKYASFWEDFNTEILDTFPSLLSPPTWSLEG